jgi:CBS domain-containing protein
MSRVADVLNHKGVDVLTIPANRTMAEAIAKMVTRNVGSILVVDDSDLILGIFTERDYLRKTILENRIPHMTSVRDVMSRDLIYVDTKRSLEDCMELMTQARIRHIPVIEKGRLTGIVSMGDVVKHLCMERGSEIKNLTDYITGRYPGEVGAGMW